ncbi:MAG: hypothetical protein AB2660_15285 [Candidatus Thiodiazotropha sp.]
MNITRRSVLAAGTALLAAGMMLPVTASAEERLVSKPLVFIGDAPVVDKEPSLVKEPSVVKEPSFGTPRLRKGVTPRKFQMGVGYFGTVISTGTAR